jgi:hypothetical protein
MILQPQGMKRHAMQCSKCTWRTQQPLATRAGTGWAATVQCWAQHSAAYANMISARDERHHQHSCNQASIALTTAVLAGCNGHERLGAVGHAVRCHSVCLVRSDTLSAGLTCCCGGGVSRPVGSEGPSRTLLRGAVGSIEARRSH